MNKNPSHSKKNHELLISLSFIMVTRFSIELIQLKWILQIFLRSNIKSNNFYNNIYNLNTLKHFNIELVFESLMNVTHVRP